MHIYGKRRKKSVFKQNNEWKLCLKNDEKYTKKKNNYWNQSNSVCRTQRHSCTFFVCLLRYTLFDAITATARTYLMNNSKNMSTNVYLMSFYHFVLPSTNGIFFTCSCFLSVSCSSLAIFIVQHVFFLLQVFVHHLMLTAKGIM